MERPGDVGIDEKGIEGEVQFNFIYFRSIVDGGTGENKGFPVWGIVEVGKSVYWRHAGRGV